MLRFCMICMALLLFLPCASAQDSIPAKSFGKSLADRLRDINLRPKQVLDLSKRQVESAVENVLGKGKLPIAAKRVREQAADDKFLGTIATFDLGGVKYSLERRMVITQLGPRNLLLERYGSDYVYDGDLVVPLLAILPAEGAQTPTQAQLESQFPGIAFSAGFPGRFGKGGLWDDGILPYEMADDFCCREELQAVVSYFENNTVFRLVRRDGHDNYIFFKNAEPLTTSRTDLGKQQGKNDVLIQSIGSNGARFPSESLIATMKHELGHEIGLIHEQLRSDRDRFIGRDTTCQHDDFFQSIRQAWIYAGNVDFAESAAELLTPYDFNSRMHYSFNITRNDGTNCDTWVRLDTCTNRDPTAANCQGIFPDADFTARDIEGMHKIYVAVPGASAFIGPPAETATFTSDNLRHRGKLIDKCLHGIPFGRDGCDAAARDKVADKFCEQKGFRDGFAPLYRSVWGTHSGYDVIEGWKSVWGVDVLQSVSCTNLTRDEQRVRDGSANDDEFVGEEVKIGNRLVDRCVHGDNIQGNRCSEANQRRIADAFCERWGFRSSSAFATDTAFLALEFNATGLDVGRNRFVDVAANDVFTSIKCERASVVSDNRRFARSEIRVNDKAVDRCVHGTPFGEDRCSSANQRRVADAFCATKGFSGSGQFTVTLAGNALASGFHPATNDFREVWASLDVLSSVECTQ